MDNRKISTVVLVCFLFTLTIANPLFTIGIEPELYSKLQKHQFWDFLQSDSRDYWPTTEWLNSTPEAQGMDSALLSQMLDYINYKEFNLDSIIVVRNGYIVLEEYPDPGFTEKSPHNLYSVTKSITSALIGIAIDKGYINDVDQKVIDFFPNKTILNLDSRKQRMTLEHLLTMSSGFKWEGPDDMLHSWGKAVLSGNPVEAILNQPMDYEPGTTWYYNGGCSHLLSAILTATTGNTTLDFAREYLFGPLGIRSVTWPTDPQGIYYGGQDIWLKPRDMAKFGYLFLNNGFWDGEQIISEDWVVNSTKPSFALNDVDAYGYQWWINQPLGAYYAYGFDEQRIYVIPDYDLVIIFTAKLQKADVEPELVSDFILPAVLERGGPDPLLFFPQLMVFVLAIMGIFTLSYWYTKTKR